MFIIYIKESKTVVTHTHTHTQNRNILLIYIIHDCSHIQIHSHKKKNHDIKI